MVCKVIDQVKRKEIKKSEKKAKILNAAALLFSRKQYHEVMIEDVAKLAFMAKGTVYNYFSSKEDLYFSIMLERMDNLLTSLDQKIKADTDSRNALKSFVIHLYMFMMKYQDFFLMYRKETLKAENELCSNIAKMNNQLRSMLKDIILNGIEDKLFRSMDTGFAADLITGSIYASVNRGIEKNYSEEEMRAERGEVFNFIYEGMSSRSSNLPLKGVSIVLTRTEEQNEESASIFRNEGAEVISFPVLKVIELETNNFRKYFTSAPDYIVLTSANAVKVFSGKLNAEGITIDSNVTRIAAVGNKTAEVCREFNLNPDIIPEVQSAEGLISFFEGIEVGGKRFLIPRSAIGREELVEYLRDNNAIVNAVDIYDIAKPDASESEERLKLLFNTPLDVITFASPSAFRNFLELTGSRGEELLKKVNIASIGNTTSAGITHAGYLVTVQPDNFDMDSLKNALIEFYKKEKN
jgi:uroporphyrinogen-III synthase